MNGLAFHLELANTLYLTKTILVILLFITLFVLPWVLSIILKYDQYYTEIFPFTAQKIATNLEVLIY